MTGWYARLDTALGSNPSGFVVGNSLTVADLRAYAVWTRHVDGVPADYFDHWPHIVAHKKKIAALPEIAAYYAAKVPAESKA
jgi:glutathione S-transferase